jgi:serralysin
MALPVFSLAQIVDQLRTSWSAGSTTTYPFAGPNIVYSVLTGNAPLDSSPENTGWLQMSALMGQRAAEAFEVWDDLIAANLTQGSANPASATGRRS